MMSAQATPFGNITFPENLSKKRRAAILRALSWCEQLARETGAWVAQQSSHGERLVRTVNGHELAVFPMVAANLDAGCSVGARFQVRHLPVEVNGLRVCVNPKRTEQRAPHRFCGVFHSALWGAKRCPGSVFPHASAEPLSRGVLVQRAFQVQSGCRSTPS